MMSRRAIQIAACGAQFNPENRAFVICHSSRRQSIDRPGAVRLERVTEAIVQTVGPALPKFDPIRFESISAPMRRKRHRAVGETLFHFFEASIENAPRINYFALMRGPR